MSVLIKGMEMQPDGRYTVCVTHDSHGVVHWVFQNQDTLEFLKHGTVTEVPEPHGRLIDADALMHEFEKAQRTMAKHGQEYSCSFMSSSQELSTEWYCVEDMLENAPTVIEAEEGET